MVRARRTSRTARRRAWRHRHLAGPGVDRVSEPPRAVRVLIVGRHPVVRAGLRGLLALRDDVEIVGEFSSVDDLDVGSSLRPDVVVLEWSDGDTLGQLGSETLDLPMLLMGPLTD